MKNLLLLCLVMFLACENKVKTNIPIYNEIDVKIESISLDTLFLEKEYFSGVGFFSVRNNQIFFVDQVFSTVISYTSDGHYQNTYLGKGDGPDEQNNIHGFQPFFYDGQHLVLDNFELVVFDSDFQKVKSYPIEWKFTDSNKNMLNEPKGDMLGIYEIDWKKKGFNTSFFISSKQDQILLPITTSHPILNAFISEDYYKNVYVLGKYDIKNQQITNGMGFRSDHYIKHSFVPNFDFSFISQQQDNLLISFAIDPLIHVIDLEGNLLYKFGKEGIGFKTSYPKTKTIEEALDNHQSDLKKAGYYQYVHHDDNDNLTFRTYYPEGSDKGITRLQIYQDKVLIGDVQVPERFRVIGKIGDYYYGDGIVDELNDKLGLYKFKIIIC